MAWIALTFIAVLCFWGLASPFAGLMGLMAVNVLDPGELYPVLAPLHVEKVVAIIVLGALFLHSRHLRFPPLTKAILILWIVMLAGAPFAIWRGGALSSALDFGKILVYNVLIVTLVNTRERFRTFLLVYTVLIGWLAASSLVSYYQGNFTVAMGIERATGVTSAGGDPNNLGGTMVASLPLFLLLIPGQSIRVKLLAICVSVLAIWTVMITGSRTSFFSLLTVTAVFAMLNRRILIYLPFAIVLFVGIWNVLPEQYVQRYKTVKSLEEDASYQNRVNSWKGGWAMFKDHPLLGIGAGQYANANGLKYWPDTEKVFLQSHSLYFQLLGELGLAGIIAFGYFLFSFLALNFRLLRRLARDDVPVYLAKFPKACNFSILAMLIAGYAGHNLFRSTWYQLAALSSALSIITTKSQASPRQAVSADAWAEAQVHPAPLA